MQREKKEKRKRKARRKKGKGRTRWLQESGKKRGKMQGKGLEESVKGGKKRKRTEREPSRGKRILRSFQGGGRREKNQSRERYFAGRGMRAEKRRPAFSRRGATQAISREGENDKRTSRRAKRAPFEKAKEETFARPRDPRGALKRRGGGKLSHPKVIRKGGRGTLPFPKDNICSTRDLFAPLGGGGDCQERAGVDQQESLGKGKFSTPGDSPWNQSAGREGYAKVDHRKVDYLGEEKGKKPNDSTRRRKQALAIRHEPRRALGKKERNLSAVGGRWKKLDSLGAIEAFGLIIASAKRSTTNAGVCRERKNRERRGKPRCGA